MERRHRVLFAHPPPLAGQQNSDLRLPLDATTQSSDVPRPTKVSQAATTRARATKEKKPVRESAPDFSHRRGQTDGSRVCEYGEKPKSLLPSETRMPTPRTARKRQEKKSACRAVTGNAKRTTHAFARQPCHEFLPARQQIVKPLSICRHCLGRRARSDTIAVSSSSECSARIARRR